MSASDITGLIVPPAVWLAGYFLYSGETAAMPVTRFWLRLTLAMTLLAVGTVMLKLLLGDVGNDQSHRILRIVQVVALVPIAFWFIVAGVRGWSR